MKLSFLKLLGILITSSIILYSCTKDKPTPAYVGTWSATVSMADSAGTIYSEREIYSFTESSFTETIQMISAVSGQWVNYVGTKGSLSVNGSVMTFNVTDVGITSFTASNQPTGTLIFYNENANALDFQGYLQQIYGGQKTFNTSFTISGKFLTFSDYPDVIYAKQ